MKFVTKQIVWKKKLIYLISGVFTSSAPVFLIDEFSKLIREDPHHEKSLKQFVYLNKELSSYVNIYIRIFLHAEPMETLALKTGFDNLEIKCSNFF